MSAMQQPGFNPWVEKIPWRRECLPTPVFLPGESHGQRSLVGYSPWNLKESDTTERLTHMDFVNIGFGEILDFSLGVIALEIFENG